MPEPTAETASEITIKPVYLADKDVLQSYSCYIRRILVGLADTARGAVMVCPDYGQAEGVLCPSVERIEHPALRLPIFWYQNRRLLLDRLMRQKPTLLHAFYPGQIHLAQWLADELDVPYVITFHQAPSRWIRFEKPIRYAARIIAPSAPIAEQLKKQWPSLTERVLCVPVGTFVEDQCSCFSRPGTVPSLVAVQPLDSFEVVKSLLNAIRHLALDGMELIAAIMGQGRAERDIRRHIRSLGLTSVAALIPPMHPMRDVFSGADIYLHLQDRGCFDAQLLEAMAVGLAVAGCREETSGLLIEGQTALFWDPQDELSIYSCLKTILSQREKTRQIAQNAQAYLGEHHSVSRMVEQLAAIYAQVQLYGDRRKSASPTKTMDV